MQESAESVGGDLQLSKIVVHSITVAKFRVDNTGSDSTLLESR